MIGIKNIIVNLMKYLSYVPQQINNFIIKFKTSKFFQQVSLLLLVNILGIPIGIITNIIITKYLGPQRYGDYILILNTFNFSIS